jgi:multidrug resistance protein, MATE family
MQMRPDFYAKPPPGLPAQRLDAAGAAHVDLSAVLALALPLIANSAVQVVLNLTDVWFIGHISMQALAAVGAVQWLILVFVMLLGGVAMAVQPLVAQAYGARRYPRAAQATWTALWGILFAVPLFLVVGAAGRWFLAPFGFSDEIVDLANSFWLPRLDGAPCGMALWAMLSFFNGIGRSRITALISAITALANVPLNAIFIFVLGWGVTGSGIATAVAQALGFAVAVVIYLRPEFRQTYRTHLTWRPHARRIWAQLKLGFPTGLLPAADLIGAAIFQMMQVRLSTIDGATTQIVMMLTSIAYMPGFGIAQAGTTLVGQSIGAGDRAWARRVGTYVILLAACYMGGAGVLIALGGSWLLPVFLSTDDVQAAAILALGTRILWLAAAYQFFDGLNLGSALCLRGAGDMAVPAAIVLGVCWFIFLPVAHALTFAPGQGWFGFLPQAGFGAVGGWSAMVLYVLLLGVTLFVRWRSAAWQAIRIYP